MLWGRAFSTIFMSFAVKRGVHSAAPMIVVFGRPGAGKSTVANEALQRIQSSPSTTISSIYPLGLDLDVCVPQWMRDNFAKGIYPTLEQRHQFAQEACDYVEKSLSEVEENGNRIAVVSFSFVNTDLRDNFRQRFPQTKWVLVDTSEEEAAMRIQQREDHFYKGSKSEIQNTSDEQVTSNTKDDSEDESDNSEWLFAPVDFEHTILDGENSIEDNAAILLSIIEDEVKQLT